MLNELHRITAYVREHEDQFIELEIKQSGKDLNRHLRDSHEKLEYPKSRVVKLDTIVQRLYKDNLDGMDSFDERFIRMLVTDDTAQKLLK